MKENSKQKFVVCIDNSEYPASLELYKIYRNIPDTDAESSGDLRIIDESGEDYIYPESYFIPIKVSQKLKQAILHTV
jgi:hypothetical protein